MLFHKGEQMKVGDLIEFKCIGAGKTDNPPYSQDGEWRTGMILKRNKINLNVAEVLYRGQAFMALIKNCRKLGDQ